MPKNQYDFHYKVFEKHQQIFIYRIEYGCFTRREKKFLFKIISDEGNGSIENLIKKEVEKSGYIIKNLKEIEN